MALNDPDHEYTPKEIRATRVQLVLILLPVLLALVVTIVVVIASVR